VSTERDDQQDDDVLASLASLRTCDVSPRRSRRLRRQCHAILHAEPPATGWSGIVDGTRFRRIVVPALGGAWCLAYLVEIIRRAAATHGHGGTP
jgi:hypothetical protein